MTCRQLTAAIPIVPRHCTVEIHGFKEVVLRSIKDHSLLTSMVHSFTLSGIANGIFLADGFFEPEKLQLINFDESKPVFTFHPDKTSWALYDHFDRIIIEEEKEDLQQQALPCRVQYLLLKDCKCPVKLGEGLQSLSFLRGLSIEESPKIPSFLEAVLPPQLRFIFIEKCDALQSLPSAWMHSSNTSLAKLFISYCDSLTCIARFHLPPNLKRLEIKHCSNLLSVLDEEEVSGSCRNTPYLEYLTIEYCPSLTSLWSKSKQLPDTREIKLTSCSKLTTLDLPKALRKLCIKGCSKLESIAKSFHDITKLENLHIEDCDMKICKSLFEWGLHKLTSLEALSIMGGCPDVMSFPEELPISLKSLKIEDFPNLERLSPIAQNLTCFEELYLEACPKLKYFPENGLLQSLKRLYINKCPLESIAKNFHDIRKLENLHIEDCERLEALPSGINNIISLRSLFMKKCPGIAVFPEGGFPKNLISLEISDMKICKSLFEWGLHKLTSLEALSITGGCPDVMSFPEEEIGRILPISLKSLKIEDFPNLERLSPIAQNLTCFEELYLETCPKLKYFPENGLPQSLKGLYINKCPLESIAKSFLDITKLENLHIEDCERLEALPSGINNLISL